VSFFLNVGVSLIVYVVLCVYFVDIMFVCFF